MGLSSGFQDDTADQQTRVHTAVLRRTRSRTLVLLVTSNLDSLIKHDVMFAETEADRDGYRDRDRDRQTDRQTQTEIFDADDLVISVAARAQRDEAATTDIRYNCHD